MTYQIGLIGFVNYGRWWSKVRSDDGGFRQIHTEFSENRQKFDLPILEGWSTSIPRRVDSCGGVALLESALFLNTAV